MKPNEGRHYMFCSKCGTRMGFMIHFGGENWIGTCKYCKDTTNECVDCYIDRIRESDLN